MKNNGRTLKSDSNFSNCRNNNIFRNISILNIFYCYLNFFPSSLFSNLLIFLNLTFYSKNISVYEFFFSLENYSEQFKIAKKNNEQVKEYVFLRLKQKHFLDFAALSSI